MTDDEKLLEFAGVWKAGVRCDSTNSIDYGSGGTVTCLECGAYLGDEDSHCQFDENDPGVITEHDIPMPPLTGDFADVVAMKCLRRLMKLADCHETDCDSEVWGRLMEQFDLVGIDPADAIFAAALAYLKEQEGK